MDLDLLALDLLALDRLRPTGLFTLAEATSRGLHRRDVSQWVRDEAIARVVPGMFVGAARWQHAGPERRHVLRALAATVSLQTPVVLSHAAACALHGLPLLSPPVALPGRRLHLTRQIPGPSQVSRHYTLHRRYGADQCAQPIGAVPALESQARLVVTALGYRMRLQVRLATAEGAFVGRVDGLIEELGVVVEVDGRVKYVGDGTGSVEALLCEKRRDSAIRDLGYGIVRLDRLALDEPGQVDTRIQDAAARAHPSVRRQPPRRA